MHSYDTFYHGINCCSVSLANSLDRCIAEIRKVATILGTGGTILIWRCACSGRQQDKLDCTRCIYPASFASRCMATSATHAPAASTFPFPAARGHRGKTRKHT